ncbi:MAG: flagellar motor switch phosphatase FliY [Lachnospiraceae bacterium]|nr:flagellar motor switch phosphatase FliY [Lachnospiraceae bacterium]
MDGMLSQEEINALLGGGSVGELSTNDGPLSDAEKDAIGEISNICMGTAATTLYSLVNQKVVITTPNVEIINWDKLISEYARPCVFINIFYKEGIDGNNVLILKEDDVKIITDLMMGGDGLNPAPELSELHFSAICEAMNQMMGSAATSLSSMLNCKVDITPPDAKLLDLAADADDASVGVFSEGDFVRITFKMTIGELVDSTMMQLYPLKLAKDLYSKFTGDDSFVEKPVNNAIKDSEPSMDTNQGMASQSMASQGVAGQPVMGQPMMGQPMMGQPMMGQAMMGQPMMGQPMMGQPMMGQPMMGQPMMGQPMMGKDVNVQNIQFQAFNLSPNPAMQQENIELIMDVPLDVSVVLGRTRKSIKEILEFAPGTIIELDKLAGEPIDVIVNQKMVAKGEVVVIEESFGIRITEIIKEK